MKIEINGLSVKQREANAAGNTLVASFDATIGVVELRECGLFAKPDGELFATPPRGMTVDKTRHQVKIADPDVYAELLARAAAAWRAFTGASAIVAAG